MRKTILIFALSSSAVLLGVILYLTFVNKEANLNNNNTSDDTSLKESPAPAVEETNEEQNIDDLYGKPVITR